MNESIRTVDPLVIGVGINGVGIARDAAGSGLRVVLYERDRLGGATSMVSSKLIHSGLSYLQQCRFRLVRESLAEREVLLRAAPYLAWSICVVHLASATPPGGTGTTSSIPTAMSTTLAW